MAQCGKLPHAYDLGRQANVDYSICQALAYRTAPIGSALIIYDVACQWSRKFHSHVENSSFLSLGPISDLIPAVGKFNLAAHVPGCSAKFSLNFVEGTVMVCPPILHTPPRPRSRLRWSDPFLTLSDRPPTPLGRWPTSHSLSRTLVCFY